MKTHKTPGLVIVALLAAYLLGAATHSTMLRAANGITAFDDLVCHTFTASRYAVIGDDKTGDVVAKATRQYTTLAVSNRSGKVSCGFVVQGGVAYLGWKDKDGTHRLRMDALDKLSKRP